eukprot:gnl/TRDRNA2_/TRDRNA2_137278_c0_seq1.p1 gnl/TRDRNA2_/TRDRNA2_137278_c0~~gnl/TRDRNA2_/TRDRNA2_137278_c0_seq1.p1  ORF type:complete len:225 (-),score=39.23 gnl/TRDRNA2_/TRDRNA2_137278_c0_seq1:51-725(-)
MATSTHVRLGEALRDRRVLLIRHGNTGKAETDAARTLTDKGIAQCAEFRREHAERLAGIANVLASSVARTTSTASHVMEGLAVPITPLDNLYFGNFCTEEMSRADSELGYVPVAEYMEKFPGVFDTAAATMAQAVADAGAHFAEGDVLIVGHAGYLQFLALEVVTAMAIDSEWLSKAREVILPFNVAEVCGFEVTSDGVLCLTNTVSAGAAIVGGNNDFVSAPK